MHKLTVGKLYNPDRTSWPPDLNQYNYHSGSHELVLFFSNPTHKEVSAVKSGRVEFGLLLHKSVVFLLYKFDPGIPWSDAPYSIHLVPEDQRSIPGIVLTQDRHLITTILVDADTGVVKVIRVVSLSHGFTASLHRAIQKQAQSTWLGAANYQQQIAEAYTLYPNTQAMIDSAKDVCVGGE